MAALRCAGNADEVADATQGLGLHRGLGFASMPDLAPAGSLAAEVAPAAAIDVTCAAAENTSAAPAQQPADVAGPAAGAAGKAAEAAAATGMSAAPAAVASLFGLLGGDSGNEESGSDSGGEPVSSSDDGSGAGSPPAILYDVAFRPGLGSGGGLGSASHSIAAAAADQIHTAPAARQPPLMQVIHRSHRSPVFNMTALMTTFSAGTDTWLQQPMTLCHFMSA